MIKAIIIDDELHARQNIKTILESQCQEIEIVAEAGSVKKAITTINNHEASLLFLDIDLPDGNAFNILSQINFKKYRIIFITAYQQYALEAIKFSAFDYILKPVNPTELVASVRNAISENFLEGYEDTFQAFFSNFSNSTASEKKVVLKTSDKIHVVDIKNIIRCEADNVYTTFYINNGNSIVVSKSIKNFDEMLNPYHFMRVHQSHLINLNYLNYYNKQEGGSLVMSDKSIVPVSGQKKALLLQYLDTL